jgi:hypothetical protein
MLYVLWHAPSVRSSGPPRRPPMWNLSVHRLQCSDVHSDLRRLSCLRVGAKRDICVVLTLGQLLPCTEKTAPRTAPVTATRDGGGVPKRFSPCGVRGPTECPGTSPNRHCGTANTHASAPPRHHHLCQPGARAARSATRHRLIKYIIPSSTSRHQARLTRLPTPLAKRPPPWPSLKLCPEPARHSCLRHCGTGPPNPATRSSPKSHTPAIPAPSRCVRSACPPTPMANRLQPWRGPRPRPEPAPAAAYGPPSHAAYGMHAPASHITKRVWRPRNNKMATYDEHTGPSLTKGLRGKKETNDYAFEMDLHSNTKFCIYYCSAVIFVSNSRLHLYSKYKRVSNIQNEFASGCKSHLTNSALE